jgi:hypothetical protein
LAIGYWLLAIHRMQSAARWGRQSCLMPHSFPNDVIPSEIRWGRPPGLRGTPSSRCFYGFNPAPSRRDRPGGRPQTWASAPPFMQMPQTGKLRGIRQSYLQAALQAAVDSKQTAHALGTYFLRLRVSQASCSDPREIRLETGRPAESRACSQDWLPHESAKADSE